MREILIGQTDYTILVKINGTDGAPETGLTEASIDLAYARVETDNDVTISDVTPAALSALTDAHTDWGFEEVDATNAPGLYRLDIADAVFASGAWEAVVTITDASGTDFYPVDIGFRLVAVNALDGVRYGLTALPNAAADAAGGLPISDAGGLDLDNRMPAATAVTNFNTVFNTDFAANYNTTLDAWNVNTTHAAGTAWGSGAITAGAIAASALDNKGNWNVGKTGYTLTAITGLGNQTADITGSISGSVGSVTGAVGSVTGNVGGNVTGSVGSVASGGITRASFAAETGLQTIRSGTAQAGGSNTITLDASASSQSDYYKHATVYVTGGTGAGQYALCTAYNGTTKVATLHADWKTAPDNTSTFALQPRGDVDLHLIDGKAITCANPVTIYAHVGTAAASTAQTGDAYSYLGTNLGLLGANATEAGGTGDHLTALGTAAELAKVPKSDSNVTWNATALASIQSEANDALVANHLDHLLAADYDPASKPGVSTALLNELVENDGGVSRYTANALEQAPSGGGGGDATAANQVLILAALADIEGAGFATGTDSLKVISDAIAGLALGSSPQLVLSTTIASVTSQTVLVLTAGSADNNAYDGQCFALIVDASTATQKTVAAISSYAGGTRTLTLATTPKFTVAASDSIYIIASGRPDANLVAVNGLPVDTGQVNVTVVNTSTVQNGTLVLYRGADYSVANSNPIHFTDVANIDSADNLYLTIVNNETEAAVLTREVAATFSEMNETADFEATALELTVDSSSSYAFVVERKVGSEYNPILWGPCTIKDNNRTFPA